MPLTSDLTLRQQRTVTRLAKGKNVAVDRITGLIESIKQDFYEANPDATGIDWQFGTTTINGEAPLGRLLSLQNVDMVADEVTSDAQVIVELGTRKAGTRVGIHVHEYGGATFVIGGKGKITDFVEGFPDAEYPAGSYSFMPANIPMSAANLTDKGVRLMDVFVNPVGEPVITFIEPGYPPA
jgi:quercetin dioxygenase-like cupin family protein